MFARWCAAFVFPVAAVMPAWGATYQVGGSGAAIASLSDVPWATLAPGDEVIVHGGVNNGVVNIVAHGTPERPITVRAAPGTHPVNERPVIFEGASYVVVDGLTVHDTMWPGFMIRHGATGITITHSTVYDTGEGIFIADGAGMNHRIIDNVLRDNKSFGLGVDTINNVPGQETIIAGNTITGNKIHGIEIMGNHYIIEGNKVSGNGWGAQGSSGIHLFAKNAKADTCKHNIIRYNISYANRDDGGEDGNGIQLDQWCDDNQVYFNVTFANEGAGINLFDAAHNVVVNNTVFDNMRGPKGHSYRTELLVASDGKNTDRASDNVIRNNIIAATRPDNVAIYVDGLSAAHPQEIGNNILFHAAPAGQVFFWNGRAGREIAVWNGLKRGAADIAADPQFTDPGQPLAGGLSVRPTSPALGHGVAIAVATTRDVLGNPLRLPPIGAYAAPR